VPDRALRPVVSIGESGRWHGLAIPEVSDVSVVRSRLSLEGDDESE
jgi:hypothetical protein